MHIKTNRDRSTIFVWHANCSLSGVDDMMGRAGIDVKVRRLEYIPVDNNCYSDFVIMLACPVLDDEYAVFCKEMRRLEIQGADPLEAHSTGNLILAIDPGTKAGDYTTTYDEKANVFRFRRGV